jgi:biopolymer transport protein ExbD
VVEAPKNVTLPESRVEAKPRETVVIFVSPEEVLVQGQPVAKVEDLLEGQSLSTSSITERLAELKESVIGPSTLAVAGSLEVTILADKSVPFIVVKRIMSACTNEGYENVSLAVIHKGQQLAAR